MVQSKSRFGYFVYALFLSYFFTPKVLLCSFDFLEIEDSSEEVALLRGSLSHGTYTPVSITKSGVYRLSTPVKAVSGVTALLITANNVTLDLDGTSISGGDVGIVVTGNNVIIKNGTVQNANNIGISLTDNTNCAIENVSVIGTRTGIEIVQGGAHLLANCRALACTQAGFSLVSSSTNSITSCHAINTRNVVGDASGFVSRDGFQNSFNSCVAQDTFSESVRAVGLGLFSEQNSMLLSCEARHTHATSESHGILFDASIGCVVEKCVAQKTSTDTVAGVGISVNSALNYAAKNFSYNNDANYASISSELITSQANARGEYNVDGATNDPDQVVTIDAGVNAANSTLTNATHGLPVLRTNIDTTNTTLTEEVPRRIRLTSGTITTPGSYYLAADFAGDININSSNVTLDLNGFAVAGRLRIAATTNCDRVTVCNGIVNVDVSVCSEDAGVTARFVEIKNLLIGGHIYIAGGVGATADRVSIGDVQTGSSLFLASGQDSLAQRVLIKNAVLGAHLYVCHVGSDARAENVQIKNVVAGGVFYAAAEGDTSVKSIVVQDSQFMASIRIAYRANDKAEDLLLDNVVCDGEIRVCEVVATAIKNLTLRNVKVKGALRVGQNVSTHEDGRAGVVMINCEAVRFQVRNVRDVSLVGCKADLLVTGLAAFDFNLSCSHVFVKECIAHSYHTEGFKFSNSVDVLVEGCTATGCGRNGFQVSGTASNITFESCSAVNCSPTSSSFAGFDILAWGRNYLLKDCSALGCLIGFRVGNPSGDNTEHCTLLRCTYDFEQDPNARGFQLRETAYQCLVRECVSSMLAAGGAIGFSAPDDFGGSKRNRFVANFSRGMFLSPSNLFAYSESVADYNTVVALSLATNYWENVHIV